MFGWLSAASVCASRLNRARRSAIGANELRQDLDRDVAIELRVARAIDLAHAARTEGERISYGPRRVPAGSVSRKSAAIIGMRQSRGDLIKIATARGAWLKENQRYFGTFCRSSRR